MRGAYYIIPYLYLGMLEKERQSCSFNKDALMDLVYGGKEYKDRFMKLQQLVANDPVMKFDPSILHQSRSAQMTHMAKKLLRFHEYFPLDGTNQIEKSGLFLYNVPLSLHGIMFLVTLRNLCDPEQEKMFLEPALRGQVTGCYAQTQLAHGSDVQGLMTTATYDPSTETFVINTPEVGAAKWWVGDLGVYASHAAVFAQLIINGKKYGIHTFVVPIRDPKTHQTHKGVEAGDIGPKMGFQTKDNGYAIFSNVRIPRKNMLMKYHVISAEGNYSIQGDPKISYATMLLTRSYLTKMAFFDAAKGAIIATRYSLVRTQFKDKSGTEIPVLNYQTQQEKILPRISEAYASCFTTQFVNDLCASVFQDSKKGKFDKLQEAHIISSGVKAIQSYDHLKGLEIARRACGGHGFHMYNGIVGVLQEYGTIFTLEGEFTVLMLQVARYLVKNLGALTKGKKLPPSVAYLEALKDGNLSVDIKDPNMLNCPFFVRKILRLQACSRIQEVGKKIQAGLAAKLTQKEIWDHHAGLVLNDAAMSHSYLLMYESFLNAVVRIQDEAIKNILTNLVVMYGIEKIIERADKFYQAGTISSEGFQMIYKQRYVLYERIRPEALNLVESFGISDNSLQSAIGSSDGRPYENLIDWAKNHNTLNRPKQRAEIIDTIKKTKAELRAML